MGTVRLSGSLVRWIAERLVEQLRRGEVPDGVTPEDFLWYPCLDHVWGQIVGSDSEMIFSLLARPETRAWGRILSRGLPESERLIRTVCGQFRAARSEDERLGAFHEVAYLCADETVRSELWEWLRENLERFLQFEKDYVGEAFDGDVLAFCRARVADPLYEKKRWVYLFTALACEGPERAEGFISAFRTDSDPFVAKMADEALILLRDRQA